MTQPAQHRRLLLDLCHMAPEPEEIAAAVEFARLLGLDLTGIFVEDEALCGLATLPFAREFRLPAHEWSPMGSGQLDSDFRAAAQRLRTVLEAAGAERGVPNRFEVVRGDPAAYVAGLSDESDVIVLGVPGSAPSGVLGGFQQAWRTHLQSRAAVLLVPPGPTRRSGPVVAILGEDDTRPAALAARIACAAGERLVLLHRGAQPEAMQETACLAGLPTERVRLEPLAQATPAALVAATGRNEERILVLDRMTARIMDHHGLPRVSKALRIPILVQ